MSFITTKSRQQDRGERSNARVLTPQQVQLAASVAKDSYPNEMPCIQCGYAWMQHLGTLCPVHPGRVALRMCIDATTGQKFMEPYVAEPARFDGATTTFLPDVDYYNQSPDFEVE